MRLSPRGVTRAGCPAPAIRSCKHTCPAASSRHLAALAKPLAQANAARISLLCQSCCQSSCQCCAPTQSRHYMSRLSAAHSFLQVPLLAAAAPARHRGSHRGQRRQRQPPVAWIRVASSTELASTPAFRTSLSAAQQYQHC
jgi:hypothetical protein